MRKTPHFLLILITFLTCIFLHYSNIFTKTFVDIGFTRHSLDRILIVLPVVYTAFVYGLRNGLIGLGIGILIMLPRALFFSPSRADAIVESLEVIMISGLIIIWYDGMQKSRERHLQDIAELETAREKLRYYLQQITRTQEEERKRMARELHDETIQDLIALERLIDINMERDPGPYLETLDDMRTRIDKIMEDLRRFSQGLRPPMLDDLGLLPTLEWLCQNLERDFNIRTAIEVEGETRRYSSEIELMLFRIAQEALRNVWRHAHASNVKIFLGFHPSRINLRIRDDGKGFSMPTPITDSARGEKFGLMGIQERVRLIGGALHISSAPGNGTTVEVEIAL